MTAIDFSSFVDQLATASGDTILPFFRTALAVENKKAGGFDPVTAADRAAEQSMRTLIRKQFPDHGILGEEYGSEHTDAEYVWVLDPIDGTKSFISGMLAWGTLIGLMRFGEPVFGMMNQPFTRERFSGDGGAAHYRGPAGKRDLHVRECASIDRGADVHHKPVADEQKRPRGIRQARGQGEALPLRRRLLRLLHAGRGADRSDHRNRNQAVRYRRNHPDRRRRRRHRHHLGEWTGTRWRSDHRCRRQARARWRRWRVLAR